MGWKAVKDHYRIGHLVHVTSKGICIGSPYISDLIVIANGELVKRYDERSNEDLRRYMAEMDADLHKLRELALQPDVFERHVPVYTYDGATIIEKACEEPGWPNVTHDGDLMYENMYSTDREYIISQAKRNAIAGVSSYTRLVQRAREELAGLEADLAEQERFVAELEQQFPGVAVQQEP